MTLKTAALLPSLIFAFTLTLDSTLLKVLMVGLYLVVIIKVLEEYSKKEIEKYEEKRR
ncbi:MAG: hypothetical protein WC764_04290 [Candidatus Paceibacterota bacterium]|jgi:hypothetical protein